MAVLALVLGWSVRADRRAGEARDLAVAIHRDILERAGLRTELLVFGGERVRQQWDAKTVALRSRLERAGELFEAPADQAILSEMGALTDQGMVLFRELAELQEAAEGGAADGRAAAALGERLTSKLTLLMYELSSRASSLVTSATLREERTQQVANALVLAIVLGALGMVILTSLLTGRFVERRLARLRAGAERIASGELAHRIAMRGDDELADLGRSFDRMAASLEDKVAQLQAANRELESFSYSVSHDLRAPLRHVVGFVGLLRERAGTGLDEKARHYLQVIADSARKMGTLIDDLLAFSRTGRAELRPGTVALGPLVAEVVEELSRELGGRTVEWTVAPLPEVRGDAALLRLVWVNLVSNALKYSRPRSPAHVEIGAVERDGELRCFVRDDGVGFDPRYAAKLFGVFQRLHREQDFEGNGVGLATVQRIVHRHGGRVWAESTPGEGAVFWFSLPKEGGA